MASMDFARTPPQIGAIIPTSSTSSSPGKNPVTSLSFHGDGIHLFSASSNERKLRLINCGTGTSDQSPIRMEKDGVRLVEATHHNYSVLTAGEGKHMSSLSHHQQHNINYLSTYDNKILRTFRGHTSSITNISMSPVDDMFLSSSLDRTVRLWNLQQPGCVAKLDLPAGSGNGGNGPHGVFDATGLVFGITAAMPSDGGNYIHLYDARKYNGGAFAELQLDRQTLIQALYKHGITPRIAADLSKAEWSSIAFNTSGNEMLVTASRGGKGGLALVLDGFNGSVKQAFTMEEARGTKQQLGGGNGGMAACFTPDDRYVLGAGGGDDGSCIKCWNVSNGSLLNKLEGKDTGNVGCIASNPKYAMFASAADNTTLWT